MLRYSALVFDEVMAGWPLTLYTPVQIARDLSANDVLVFQLVVAFATGTTPTMTVQLEHSADGRLWMPRADIPEIDQVALDLLRPTSAVGWDSRPTARLRYARLRVDLSDRDVHIPTTARVRLYAVGRDDAKRDPCECEKELPSDGTHHQVAAPPDWSLGLEEAEPEDDAEGAPEAEPEKEAEPEDAEAETEAHTDADAEPAPEDPETTEHPADETDHAMDDEGPADA